MSFRPVKPTALTFAVFFLFAISIIAALFVKDNRLWMDEILSYFFITDPSLAHVNKAVVSGIEQTPPLFFNLYWLIGHVISTDILFLKAVSVVLFALTMALFYRYTTRLIGSPVLNFVVITGLAAFTYINITLSIQIRSYALFLLVTFLYVTVIHRLIQQPGNPKLLALHVGMGLLLIMAHNFGLFYLATAGAFFGVLWLWSRDNRYWYVIGTFGLIGAVWLLTWYPYFAMQAKTGEPHSWIPMPTWRTFFRIVGDLAPTLSNKMEESTGSVPLLAMLRFVALTGLFAYVAIPRLRKGFRATAADTGFTFYLLAGFFYAVPIIITLIVTYVHTSLFISRYLWPTHLLVIYQLLYAGYVLMNRPATASIMPRFGRGQLAGLLVGAYSLMAGWFLFYQARKLILAPATVMAYVDQLDRRMPIFLESAVQFLPSWYYNRDRPIHYLLDYESAFAPGNDSGTTVAYHTLTGVKNQFGVDAVLPLSAFNARRFPHFYVVDERWNYQIERFIANGSVRVLRRMPTTLDGFTILECEFVGQHT